MRRWGNPEGAELRLTVDGEVQLTDVSHHLFALTIVALAWRERYHQGMGVAATIARPRDNRTGMGIRSFSMDSPSRRPTTATRISLA